MGMDIKSVIADTGTKAAGAWVEYPDADGVEFQLAYFGNDDYQDYVAQRMTRTRRGRRDIPPEKAREILVDGLVRFIIKSWKGLTSDGQPYEFSQENAKTLLMGSAILRDFVVSEANNIDNFTDLEPDEVEATPTADLKSSVQVATPVG